MAGLSKTKLRNNILNDRVGRLTREVAHLKAVIEGYENGTSIHQFRAAVTRAVDAESRVAMLEEILELNCISVPEHEATRASASN